VSRRADKELTAAVRSAAQSHRDGAAKSLNPALFPIEETLVHYLIGYLSRDFPEFSRALRGACDEYRRAYWPFPEGDEG